MRYLPLFVAVNVALLSACSSDGDDTTQAIVQPPANVAPVINVTERVRGDEKSSLNITATVTDSDGSVSALLWEVTSGQTLALQNDTADTVTLTLPEVMQDEEITLQLTATDDDNATSTQSVVVDITQLTIPLTIAGLATDAPLANAQVLVNVSGMDTPVSVTANASGEYLAELVLDDSQVDAFIAIQANGVGEQANAGLYSLLGNVSDLAALAGADNQLDAQEYFAVNVTNYTTAQYALLAQQGETRFDSVAALQEATNNLDSEQVIRLATAIKVAIDKATDENGLQLPTGTQTTLEMATDPDVAAQYLLTVLDSDEYNEALVELFADENVIAEIDSWAVARRYYIKTTNSISSSSYLNFETASTGFSGATPFSWDLSNGVVTMTFDETEFSTFTSTVDIEGVSTDVEISQGVTQNTMKRLQESNGKTSVLFTRTFVTRYPNGELPNEEEQSVYVNTLYTSEAFASIELPEPASLYIGIPGISGGGIIAAERFTLSSGASSGTATGKYTNDNYTWMLNDGELELSAFSSQTPGTINQVHLIEEAKGFDTVVIDEVLNGELQSSVVSRVAIVNEPVVWNASTLAGKYAQIDGTQNTPNLKIWWEFHESGNAEFFRYSDLSDGNGYKTRAQYGKWQVNDAGDLLVQLALKASDSSSTQACRDPQTAGCKEGNRYVFDLAKSENGVFSVIEQRGFANLAFSIFQTTIAYDLTAISEHLVSLDTLVDANGLTFASEAVIDKPITVFKAGDEALVQSFTLKSDGIVESIIGNSSAGTWEVNEFGALLIDWQTGFGLDLYTMQSFDEVNQTYMSVRSNAVTGQDESLILHLGSSDDVRFTQSDVANKDYFIVFYDEDECGSDWALEELTFYDTGTYELDGCLGGPTEIENYELLTNGAVFIDHNDGEYLTLVGKNNIIDGILICWDRTLNGCALDETGYMFSDRSKALAYVEAQRNAVE